MNKYIKLTTKELISTMYAVDLCLMSIRQQLKEEMTTHQKDLLTNISTGLMTTYNKLKS